MKKKWIQGAIEHPGAFSEMAHEKGMGTMEMAHTVLKEGSRASTKTKRRAILAETLMKERMEAHHA